MNKEEYKKALSDIIFRVRRTVEKSEDRMFSGYEQMEMLKNFNFIEYNKGIIEGLKQAYQTAELLDEQKTITEQLKQNLFGGTQWKLKTWKNY